jgi:AGZA family xanthine/uracil permease-like MFS transporter
MWTLNGGLVHITDSRAERIGFVSNTTSQEERAESESQGNLGKLDRFFKITERGSTVWREVRGGVVTFATMAYIIVLSPLIMGFAKDAGGKFLGGGAAPNIEAIAAGTALVGLFITLIGFVDSGWVRRMPDIAATTVPVQLGGNGTLQGWPVVIFAFGLLLLVALWAKGVKGAILISIAVTTVVAVVVEQVVKVGPAGVPGSKDYNTHAWTLNVPALPDKIVAVPHFDTLGHFSLFGSFQSAGIVTALLFVFTLLLADFFDTMGTMTAIGAEAGLLDEEGMPPNSGRILLVDSLAAVAGGAGGVSSNTSYIESASGVGDGARTGLASVITGLLFLASTVFAPLVAIIPNEAAVPALVLVGFLMMQQVRDISWDDFEIALPAFLTIVLMPFTYSISVGIGAGFISYVFIKAVRGKFMAVHPLLWIVSLLFVLYFGIDAVKVLLGNG